MEEETKERITLGNKAYYANQQIIKSKLVSKKAKLKLYRTIIRPVITNASETWVLKESMKSNLIRNKNIINYITAQRFSWFGHVHRTTNDRMVNKL